MTSGNEGGVGTHLRYLDASRIDSPAGTLSHVDVESVDGEDIGDLDGVLIDPAARCIRYYVVALRRRLGRRRYLLPADEPAQLEPGRKALRFLINSRALRSFQEFRKDDVREFSDLDLVNAMFAR
jgi:hypothetical protein